MGELKYNSNTLASISASSYSAAGLVVADEFSGGTEIVPTVASESGYGTANCIYATNPASYSSPLLRLGYYKNNALMEDIIRFADADVWGAVDAFDGKLKLNGTSSTAAFVGTRPHVGQNAELIATFTSDVTFTVIESKYLGRTYHYLEYTNSNGALEHISVYLFQIIGGGGGGGGGDYGTFGIGAAGGGGGGGAATIGVLVNANDMSAGDTIKVSIGGGGVGGRKADGGGGTNTTIAYNGTVYLTACGGGPGITAGTGGAGGSAAISSSLPSCFKVIWSASGGAGGAAGAFGGDSAAEEIWAGGNDSTSSTTSVYSGLLSSSSPIYGGTGGACGTPLKSEVTYVGGGSADVGAKWYGGGGAGGRGTATTDTAAGGAGGGGSLRIYY